MIFSVFCHYAWLFHSKWIIFLCYKHSSLRKKIGKMKKSFILFSFYVIRLISLFGRSESDKGQLPKLFTFFQVREIFSSVDVDRFFGTNIIIVITTICPFSTDKGRILLEGNFKIWILLWMLFKMPAFKSTHKIFGWSLN